MLLTADKIHNGICWLPQGSTIEVNDNGVITAIHDSPLPGAEVYHGILAPGFVNVHCHLELSHLKAVVPEGTGLIPFLQNVMRSRGNISDKEKDDARHKAFIDMLDNGIVAIGDIANTAGTLTERASGKMHFHTFIESIGFTENPQKQFAYASHLYDDFAQQYSEKVRLTQSIVPHAPYSVSHVLFNMIDKHNAQSLLSIHNQESPAEDQYYFLKQGGVQTLLHGLGISDDFFRPSGKSSLQTYLEWLSLEHPFIFVHNTYTTLNDIQVAKALLPNVYWCLCPNANLYIEETLPQIDVFIQEDVTICIGTDSLASNHQLCVLSELYTIRQHYPHIEWETLLRWGTYNGSKALQISNLAGNITVGMQPGIIHIQGIDEGLKPAVTKIF